MGKPCHYVTLLKNNKLKSCKSLGQCYRQPCHWQNTQNTFHYIKTLYGISKTTYQYTEMDFLFVPVQKSALEPFLWLICFIIIGKPCFAINTTTLSKNYLQYQPTKNYLPKTGEITIINRRRH